MNYFIFDVAGTLYDFDKGQKNNSGRSRTYEESDFKKDLLNNVRSFFQKELGYSDKQWAALKDEMTAKNDPKFSLLAQNRHGVRREDYFNYVWNLEPSNYVLPNENLKRIFETTKNNLIVSNAGKIWVSRVLNVPV